MSKPLWQLKPEPNRDAERFLRGRPALSRRLFDRLLPEIRARAFTVSGVEHIRTLEHVRDLIAELAESGDWRSVRERIISELQESLGQRAATRATLVLRMNTFLAFEKAVWDSAQADVDTTHLQYLATPDERTRPAHRALDGLVLPKDDPFWRTHYPPWEWNCRCSVVPLSAEDVAEIAAEDAQRPPDERLVLRGRALQQVREGRLRRAGVEYDLRPQQLGEPEETFRWDPSSLGIPLSALQQRFDPQDWSAFAGWARKTRIDSRRTVWDWLSRQR